MSYSIRKDCRLCGCVSLWRELTLPNTPLANEFPPTATDAQEEFPLYLVSCVECSHVQLPVVVDPERLFRNYLYVSGTSPVFVEHFRRYAEEMIRSRGLRRGDLVVEIGSNDGTLLRFFEEAGMRILGVDPAREIAQRATESGIPTVARFFDEALAMDILLEHGPASLVLANNVFAHADDLAAIARGVKTLLADNGTFVFEVSYILDVLRRTLFDTIYHEHLSYHSVEPLLRFFHRHGMSLRHAYRVDTHGGSIRCEVVPYETTCTPSAAHLIAEERAAGLGKHRADIFPFRKLDECIVQRREELRRALDPYLKRKATIVGYGAPAKATTLLSTYGIAGSFFDYVVDDSPYKQGRYMPGGRTPVYASDALQKNKPDVIVILAWNFAESILKRLTEYRASGGVCIVPLPDVRVVKG